MGRAAPLLAPAVMKNAAYKTKSHMYGIRISHMLIALTWQTDNTHMFHVVTIKCDNGVWSIHLVSFAQTNIEAMYS